VDGNLILILWFFVIILIQIWILFCLVRAFFATPIFIDNKQLPKALVVMSLRGTDPFLLNCLQRLCSMNYPDYKVRLVIDSPQDSAGLIVQEFINNFHPDNLEVIYLENRLLHASGKVSGMLQATVDLHSDYKIVAFFDGDALVHPDCLTELVTPLFNLKVGVTSGNRWYQPDTLSLGAFMRSFWNAFAVPIMNVVEIPWGGCMAVNANLMRDTELRNHLANTFGEDSSISTFLRCRGLRVKFVPQATIINRESIQIRSFYNFLVRQLLTVRLHNSRFMIVFLHMFTFGMTLALSFFLMLIPSNFQITLLVGFLALVSTLFLQPLLGHFLVRRAVFPRGEKLNGFSLTSLPWIVVALFLLCFVNLFATIHSFFVRKHAWRGITYKIGGQFPATVLFVQPCLNSAVTSLRPTP